MRHYTSPRAESTLPAISNCWTRKDCDGPAQELPLERVAPKTERKREPASKPLFGNPFESFENAFQSISFW